MTGPWGNNKGGGFNAPSQTQPSQSAVPVTPASSVPAVSRRPVYSGAQRIDNDALPSAVVREHDFIGPSVQRGDFRRRTRRRGSFLGRWFWRLMIIAAFFYGPLLYLVATVPIQTVETARPAEAALIFGALVRRGQISPLHAARLDAGHALLDRGVVQKLVVSNAPDAAKVMAWYLRSLGVPAERIETDGNALHTPETCINEHSSGRVRDVLLVSQRFHLPRIALQCNQAGVYGQLVATAGPAPTDIDIIDLARIRIWQYSREAALVWAALTGLYPTREQGALPSESQKSRG